MDSTGSSSTKRVASYADALRGRKVITHKTKPAGDKTVQAEPGKEVPKSSPPLSRKTSSKNGSKTSKKGSKKGANAIRKSDPELPKTKQSRKDPKPKSPPSKPRESARKTANTPSSYAEAVKGKPLTTPLKFENSGNNKKARTPRSRNTKSTPSGLDSLWSPQSNSSQRSIHTGDLAGADSCNDAGWDPRWDEIDGIIRPPAALPQPAAAPDNAPTKFTPNPHAPPFPTPVSCSQPYRNQRDDSKHAPEDPALGESPTPAYSHDPYATSGQQWRHAELYDCRKRKARLDSLVLKEERPRRFSAGDVPSSISRSSAYVLSRLPRRSTIDNPTNIGVALLKRGASALPMDHVARFSPRRANIERLLRDTETMSHEDCQRVFIASHDAGEIS